MSDTVDQEHELDNGAGEINASVLEQVRQRRRDLRENRQTFLGIPGYEDIGLVAQYHLLDGKQMTRIVDKVQKQVKDKLDRGIFVALDTLIAACDGLFLATEDGKYIPFDPSRSGAPLTFEPDLAAFLGLEDANTARKVVRGLFGENEAAIASHAMKLNRWFQDTSKDADQDFLGEL